MILFLLIKKEQLKVRPTKDKKQGTSKWKIEKLKDIFVRTLKIYLGF